MPDRDVATIKDLIYYQYADIIAPSALHVPDGTTAKANHYGFVEQTFREPRRKLFTYLRTSPLALRIQLSSSNCHTPFMRIPT